MKKLLALLMAIVMVLSLAACGSKKDEAPEATEEPTTEEAAPAEGEEAPAEGEEAPAEGEETPAEGEEEAPAA